ncbi:MAG TPA: amino acid--tRNA ligase-related protein, partial [Nitrospiria bacterium]|nr:amino acid--tRNA ligase-related protein [Nitrospiria bacterium]
MDTPVTGLDDLNDQIQQRLKKIEKLKELGVSPFGVKFKGDLPAREIMARYGTLSREALEEKRPTAVLAGRVVGLRRFGKASFLHLQDHTGKIQAYFKKDLLSEQAYAVFELLDLGDIIGVEGRLFRTKTNELTIEAGKLTFLTKAIRPLPEKWHGLSDVEIRYRQRYLDLIANPEVKDIFIKRIRIIELIRKFMNEKGFLEVETPMMQARAGGAAARPFVTHHHALNIPLFLRIAPELYLKRLIVGGFDKVYEINRNFRNEGVSTTHNPEFTMLEFYMAYADYQDLMSLTEEMLSGITREIVGDLRFT